MSEWVGVMRHLKGTHTRICLQPHPRPTKPPVSPSLTHSLTHSSPYHQHHTHTHTHTHTAHTHTHTHTHLWHEGVEAGGPTDLQVRCRECSDLAHVTDIRVPPIFGVRFAFLIRCTGRFELFLQKPRSEGECLCVCVCVCVRV